MSDLNLTSFNPLYPMRIHPYKELLNDSNVNIMDKVNAVIDYLNQVGKLTNDVVKDWNTVYQWVMNDGLTTDVNNKLEAMLANHEFDPIMNNILTKIGDLTTLQTVDKDTLVHAINDLVTEIGSLSSLQTSDKSSIVNAINANVASLAEKANQSDIPGWVNIKKFGAKGDGVTDDSQAFITAFTSGVETLYIPPGTYIINLTSTGNNNSRDFCDSNVYNVKGVKGKSIIRLGSGNGNIANYTGYQAIFSYSGTDVDVNWQGITFDFNYANNKPQQVSGQYAGVDINGQQMAINCYHTRDFIVRDCTFIDQSGTNCLNYRSSAANTRNAIVNIEHNQFLNMGQKWNYNNSGTMVDAYHDCSTISIHLDTTLSTKLVTAYIRENTAIAAGHNGYDFCECGANISYFENNTIDKYCIGFMPLGSTPNVESHCLNNTMTNMIVGLNIWNGVEDVSTAETDLAFSMLDIRGNRIHINPVYHMYTPTFIATTINGSNIVTDHVFGLMKWGGTPSRSIDKLLIRDNVFEYQTDATVTGYPASLTNYSCNGINFYVQFSGSVLTGFTKTPFLIELDISRNKFLNIWRQPIMMLTYPRIDKVKVEDNLFYNCNNDTVWNNPAAQLVDIRLFGNSVSPYNVNTNINAYNEITCYINNRFKGVSSSCLGMRLSLLQNSYSVPNSMFIYKSNFWDRKPSTYYSMAVSSGTAPNVSTDLNYGQATIPTSGTNVTVTHNLGFTPSNVFCTPQGNIGNVWVSGITSTQFVINCATAPAGNTIVSWRAEA